ncbi:uncharacterized protein LOC121405176 [Drosophila obscura]|uniref:uncharacterized protein LOC121405176 n=1 Tax=Drosophila obscura TaxID=7282 RepID=UPI001BB2A2BE|nr:uncharacterized protein LOC121405176 [Drosophila obscura]
MKIIQINLNHCEVTQQLLEQTVREHRIDVAVISEQYRNRNSEEWIADCRKKAAIWSCGSPTQQLRHTCVGDGFARARLNDVYIYSCYLPPSLTLQQATAVLEGIADDAREKHPTIIAGDFNAWATEWGCPRTNPRGQVLLESFATLDAVLLNTGSQQTFGRAGTGSIIDLTFASSSLSPRTTWKVSDIYTGSDHSALIYEVKDVAARNSVLGKQIRYKVETLEPDMVRAMFEHYETSGTASERASQLAMQTLAACDASMLRKRPSPGNRSPTYWWTADIASARRECHHKRRLYQRSRGSPEFERLQGEYKECRRLLKRQIKESKRKCFEKLCEDADANPWGYAYRLVMKKLRVFSSPPPMCADLLANIVGTLFPE